MSGYKAFWRGKECEVHAATMFEAQQAAAIHFKARKRYEVTVVLCQRDDGSTVTHATTEF